MTVVASSRRLDLAVPGQAPVADLLPDVVALAGEPVSGAALARWVLARVGTGDLPAAASLESAGVVDGEVLYLRRLDEPAVGLQGVDLVERASGGATGFTPAADRALLGAVCAAVLVVVAGLLLRDGRARDAAAAAVLAVLAVVAGRWLAGTRRAGASPATVALSAAPLLAVAALTAAVRVGLPGGSAGRGAAAAAGAAVGAALAAVVVRGARPPAAALGALAATSALAALLSLPLTVAQSAAVVACAAVLAVPLLPRLVLRACGVRLSGLQQAERGAGQLGRARQALPWVLAADGVVVAAACGLLAWSDSGAQLPLAAVCGLLLLLRSRSRRGAADVLPLAVPAYLALLAAGAGLALAHPRTAPPLAVLVASAAAAVAAAAVPDSAVDGPRWAGRRRVLEVVALVALVPLLAAVLGVFGAVVELSRGAE